MAERRHSDVLFTFLRCSEQVFHASFGAALLCGTCGISLFLDLLLELYRYASLLILGSRIVLTCLTLPCLLWIKAGVTAGSYVLGSQSWVTYCITSSNSWLKSTVNKVAKLSADATDLIAVTPLSWFLAFSEELAVSLNDPNMTFMGLLGFWAGTIASLAVASAAYCRSLGRFGLLQLAVRIIIDATLIAALCAVNVASTLPFLRPWLGSWRAWVYSWDNQEAAPNQAILVQEQKGNERGDGAGTIEDELRQELCSSCDTVLSSLDNIVDGAVFQLGFTADITEERWRQCPLCRLVYTTIRCYSIYSPLMIDNIKPLVLKWNGELRQFRLRQYHPPPSTRFLEFDSFICVVKEQGSRWSALAGARALIEEQFDPERIRRWLNACESSHLLCKPISYEGMKRFPYRVIDIEFSRVVEAPDNCRYVCLSYVWGMAINVQLTQQTLSRLSSVGGLNEVLHKLPRTIRETIELLRLLKERYLWVDSLCLVQDDSDDMRKGIDNMASIYSRASFTVVAAAGMNANSGLPGLTIGSRQVTRHIEQIRPELKMTVVQGVGDQLEPTQWFKRAWTFQEMISSPRAVMFFDDRVRFYCGRCTVSEDLEDEDGVVFSGYHYEVHKGLNNLLYEAYHPPYTTNPISNYVQLVTNYTSRALTDPSDIENALISTLCRLHHHSQNFFPAYSSALPLQGLGYFLLFKCIALDLDTNNVQRRVGFPSWSWTGWFGETFWDNRDIAKEIGEIEQWTSRRTWISWYLREPQSEPQQIHKEISRVASYYTSTEYVAPSPCMKSDWPFGSTFPHPQKDIPEKTQPFAGPKEAFSKLHHCYLKYRILQFWSVTIWLTSSSIVEVGFGHYADLLDINRQICGSIWLGGTDHFDVNLPHKLVVLSEARYACRDDPWIKERHKDDQIMIESPDLWDLFWVMLLDQHGEYYERRGIGQVFQRTLERSLPPGPSWEEIILA